MEGWDRYSKDWTGLSFSELSAFSSWMNRFIGYSPTIIGGWAVYFYNPNGFGSTDIDVVLPDRNARDQVINKYLASNGYALRKRAFGETEWVKRLAAGGRTVEHFLDVCTLQDKNPVHGRDIEVPWSIAMKNQRREHIGSSELFIPGPEPLLVLKLKAAFDRAHDIKVGGGTPYLRDKLQKDRFDIVSLLAKCKFDSELLDGMIADTGFGECAHEALSRAVSDRTVVDRHGLDAGGVRFAVDNADRILKRLRG
jgi:hypothetical protein